MSWICRDNTWMQLDLDLLRTFVTLHRTGGFTRAGEFLGRSQPAISLQLKRLEERVGAPVFQREGRSMALTPSGELLLDYAQRILSLHDEAASRLRLPPVQGYLRLGIMEELGPWSLPKVLSSFVRIFAEANLELEVKPSSELLTDLGRGRLDFAFATFDAAAGEALPAWTEALAWVAQEGAPAPTPIEGRLPLVALQEPSRHRQIALDTLKRAGWSVEVVCTSSTMVGVRAAVAAGIGIAAVGRGDLGLGLSRLVEYHGRPLPLLPDLQVALYSNGQQSLSITQLLLEHVRKTM